MNVDVLIIGAGPAGLAAAHTLVHHSASVCVVDQLDKPGGQISRGRVPRRPTGDGNLWQIRAGIKKGGSLLPSAVTYLSGTTAVGFERHAGAESGWDPCTGLTEPDPGEPESHSVWLNSESSGLHPIHAKTVLIATGAYDLPVPVPGWHLPGVIGVGALETLLKSGGFDGTQGRFVLAGSHPLLLITAGALIKRGHRVECVALELHPRWSGIARSLPGPGAALRKSPLLWTALRTLVKAKVPLLWDAELARLTFDGCSLRGHFRHRASVETFDGDYVGLGYGFLANSHLARQAGCVCKFDIRAGGWIVQHHQQQTSTPGVFVAGEQTGISGSEAAACEGRLAGLMMATFLGQHPVSSRSLARADRDARKWNRMGRSLRELSHHDEAWLLARVSGESLICRCEALTMSQITGSKSVRISNLRQTKLGTRVSMGPCQGRICGPLLSAFAVGAGADVGGLSPRFPIEPINIHRTPEP